LDCGSLLPLFERGRLLPQEELRVELKPKTLKGAEAKAAAR
jgi:hypothetical protein